MQIAYYVLLIALASTVLTFLRLQENNRASDRLRFERHIAFTKDTIGQGLTRCVDQMYNMRALFVASENVRLDQWDAYLNTMNVRYNDLGIRTLGYVGIVTAAEKEEFVQQQRANHQTNFTIIPAGDRQIYYPAVYTTFFDTNAVVVKGLDHATRPDRFKIARLAIAENKPVATGSVKLIDANGLRTNSGVFIYLPIYKKGLSITNVAQREASAQGLIYMTIVPKRIMTTLFDQNENQQEPEVNIEVFDGAEVDTNKLLYDSDGDFRAGNPENHSTLTRQISMPILNRQWTVLFSTAPEFDANSTTRYLQWLALFGGLTVSALLFGITWVQINHRLLAECNAVELKRSKTALAAEKKLLDITLNSIAEGVITTDTSGKVISTNKAVESLTGWLQIEAEGKYLSEIFHLVRDDTHEPCPNPVEKAIQTCASVEVENHTLLVARDGTERAVATGAAPIRDNAGGVAGAVLVFRDVTEKQKAEAQMLTESKLKSVGLLAGGIAHDFNNMLTAIIGNLSLARLPGSSREEILELLADAEKSALAAKDLTQQLLTFAKGGAPIRKPTLLHELIRKACQFALRGSNVQCDYSLAGDSWPVEVDEGQIRQILNNLMINARQAMPEGGKMELHMENAELSANAIPPLPAGKYVKISIKDNGPGIPPEHLSRIFEPYFTTKKAGTGLGLATVYSIIQKHDGQIKVVSESGKGTTFEIYLPASQQPATPASVEPKSEIISGHGRVLVVDDEAPIRKFLSVMLRKFGYETETANDGGEGIECYITAKSGGAPFDAVIMDLTIPNGMGGCEATRRLRELDPKVKVIASSGYSLDPVMANYHDYGFCGVIPKPYRPEQLSRVLKEIILAN